MGNNRLWIGVVTVAATVVVGLTSVTVSFVGMIVWCGSHTYGAEAEAAVRASYGPA